VDVGGVWSLLTWAAPALSSSLSTWPGIVVVDDLGGVAVVIDDLAGVVVVHDVLVWWQAGGRRRRCGVTWQWSWSQ